MESRWDSRAYDRGQMSEFHWNSRANNSGPCDGIPLGIRSRSPRPNVFNPVGIPMPSIADQLIVSQRDSIPQPRVGCPEPAEGRPTLGQRTQRLPYAESVTQAVLREDECSTNSILKLGVSASPRETL